jgi:tripartite-type tricarboxylate transporter receptor subunit TctC
MWRCRALGGALCAAAAAGFLAGVAQASDFYAGKTITLVVGFAPGGGYDLTARLLARHLPRFIPGRPKIVVTNMPGASGIKSLNYLYSVAPKDGTTLATFHSASPFYEAIGTAGVQYKAAELTWIGNLSRSVNVVAVWHDAGVRSVDDAKKVPVIMAALAGAGIMDAYPRLLNRLFGTMFNIVAGYDGTNNVNIALERGEVQGATTAWNTWKITRPEWVREGKIVPLVQIGPEPDPDLSDVPMLTSLAESEEQLQMLQLLSANVAIERPFAGPPGIPPDRLAILRRAFDRVTADREFLAEAERLRVDVAPQSGETVEQIVKAVTAAPPETIRKLKAELNLH